MNDHINSNVPVQNDTVSSSGLGLLCRLFWFFIGNIILLILAIKIAFPGTKSIAFDIFYWITTFCLILTRYFDIRFFKGQTAYSEPATMVHWKRYSIFIVLISVGLFVISRAIGHYFGKGF